MNGKQLMHTMNTIWSDDHQLCSYQLNKDGLNGRRGSKCINGNRKLSSTYYFFFEKTHRVLLVQVLSAAVSLVAVVTSVCDDSCGYTYLLPEVSQWAIGLGWDQLGFPVM